MNEYHVLRFAGTKLWSIIRSCYHLKVIEFRFFFVVRRVVEKGKLNLFTFLLVCSNQYTQHYTVLQQLFGVPSLIYPYKHTLTHDIGVDVFAIVVCAVFCLFVIVVGAVFEWTISYSTNVAKCHNFAVVLGRVQLTRMLTRACIPIANEIFHFPRGKLSLVACFFWQIRREVSKCVCVTVVRWYVECSWNI